MQALLKRGGGFEAEQFLGEGDVGEGVLYVAGARVGVNRFSLAPLSFCWILVGVYPCSYTFSATSSIRVNPDLWNLEVFGLFVRRAKP